MFASRKTAALGSATSPITLASNTSSSAETQPLVQLANLLKHRHFMVGDHSTGIYGAAYLGEVLEFYCRILAERLDNGALVASSSQNWIAGILPITNTPLIEICPERFFSLLEMSIVADPLKQMQEYAPLIRESHARFHALMG